MAFDGSGVFRRLQSWVLNASLNINILPDLMDQDTDDIAAGLSMCITRDGQGAPTANITWGGFKLTALGTPTVATDAANKGYVDTATSDRSMGGFKLTNVATPVADTDAANKAYVASFAYSVSFPSQTNYPYFSLITNGSSVQWGVSAAESLGIVAFAQTA